MFSGGLGCSEVVDGVQHIAADSVASAAWLASA
jgi:hypothetical protein